MPHTEYIREVPGATGAVLMIHGILGTPNHFRDLVPLIPDDWSIYNILLDGHGGSVADFSHTSMEKWQSQVSAQLDALLQRYDRVILTAHSMGTLFSIQEAVRRPEKIDSLFLLQVPLRPRLKLRYGCCAVLLCFGIVPKMAQDMARGSSVTLTWRLWQYLGWIPRFLELFAQCKATRRLLEKITVPCHIFQSARDEMVSMRTCKDLQKHPHLHVTVLENSGHFAYKGTDLALLQAAFSQLFK